MATARKTKTVVETPATVEAQTFPYTLSDVIQATKDGYVLYTLPAFHNPLIESGDVEINAMMEKEDGSFATRATEKHVNIQPEAETSQTPNQTQESNTMSIDTSTAPVVAAKVKPVFQIESGTPPEKAKRVGSPGAGRTPIYPFDQLEINQYFFVADKADDKPAVKALQSTVASANNRYSEPVPGEFKANRKGEQVPVTRATRKFKAFDSEKTLEDGTVVKGAKVFRVALDSDTLEA